jgi:hypothetical protein
MNTRRSVHAKYLGLLARATLGVVILYVLFRTIPRGDLRLAFHQSLGYRVC